MISLMWDIKQKATNEQTNKTHRHRQQYGGLPEGKGWWGEVREGNGIQIYGDGRRLNFG